MKLIILLTFVAVVAARPNDEYSRYENFNVDEIISNKRLLKAYCDCFLGTGKCTPEGSDFKNLIPDAVQNKCAKCSNTQKPLIAKFIIAIQEQLSEEGKKLNKLYDPENKGEASLKEFLQKHGH